MNNVPSWKIYLPLLFALFLVTGIFIGSQLKPGTSATDLGGVYKSTIKISDLVDYIHNNYVDTVNTNQLTDAAMQGLVQSLDPHSQYIPAEDFHEVSDPLKGNFEGIGVQFRLIRDSMTVIRNVSGGPAEKAGILPGDRVVRVNGKLVAGKKLNDEDIVRQIKGPGGSEVKLEVHRRGSRELLPFTVRRDVIPTFSMDAAYMISPGTGFIRFSRFSATTKAEVTGAINRLTGEGMKRLILDLRGNSGGYLQTAIDMAEQFLPAKTTIVYTEGLRRPRKVYTSAGNGLFTEGGLVVLMDEGSASASEILAGAVQDNDRGTIIGRRSYGKGLVQEELNFADGSAVRLTVAKYYTPTGRCIQRHYDRDGAAYAMEPFHRRPEWDSLYRDSHIASDTLKYVTPKGKVVYGGGGIMPDILIKPGAGENGNFLTLLHNAGLIDQVAVAWVDDHRAELSRYRDVRSFEQQYDPGPGLYRMLLERVPTKEMKERMEAAPGIRKLAESELKAWMTRFLFEDGDFFYLYNKKDPAVQRAVSVLQP